MKLSIVTINYNNAAGLKKTLESVASQQLDGSFELEHIIIDGASTDGSDEIAKDYQTEVNVKFSVKVRVSVKVVSEPDNGIYNAMNKGIRMATGDYIQILNSGDVLAANDVIVRMACALKENHYPEFIYGNMLANINSDKRPRSREVSYSLLNYFGGTMNHDCCWIKRTLFVDDNANLNPNLNANLNEKRCYGLYDESLKIVSDWKWFLQAIGLGRVEPVYVDLDMTIFDLNGVSEKNLALRNAERRKVLEEVLPPAVLADYDKHAFDMEQMDNLRKHPWAYKLVWTLERILNRLDNKNFKKPKK